MQRRGAKTTRELRDRPDSLVRARSEDQRGPKSLIRCRNGVLVSCSGGAEKREGRGASGGLSRQKRADCFDDAQAPLCGWELFKMREA
jgi:hypothetical protein